MTAVHQFLVYACIRKGSLLTRISEERDTEREKERARVIVERQFINCLWLLELIAQSNRKQKIILKIDSSGCFSSHSCQALASLTRITYHWELFQRYLKVSAQVKDTHKKNKN